MMTMDVFHFLTLTVGPAMALGWLCAVAERMIWPDSCSASRLVGGLEEMKRKFADIERRALGRQ